MDLTKFPEDVLFEMFDTMGDVEASKMSYSIPNIMPSLIKYRLRHDRTMVKLEKIMEEWNIRMKIEEISNPEYICGFFAGIKCKQCIERAIPRLIENEEFELIEFCTSSRNYGAGFLYRIFEQIFTLRKLNLYWLVDKYRKKISRETMQTFHVFLCFGPNLTIDDIDTFLKFTRSTFPRYLRRSFDPPQNGELYSYHDSFSLFTSRLGLPMSSYCFKQLLESGDYIDLYYADPTNLKRLFRIEHFKTFKVVLEGYKAEILDGDIGIARFVKDVLKNESCDLFTMTISAMIETLEEFTVRFEKCKNQMKKPKLFEVIHLAMIVYGYDICYRMINSFSSNQHRQLKRYLTKRNVELN